MILCPTCMTWFVGEVRSTSTAVSRNSLIYKDVHWDQKTTKTHRRSCDETHDIIWHPPRVPAVSPPSKIIRDFFYHNHGNDGNYGSAWTHREWKKKTVCVCVCVCTKHRGQDRGRKKKKKKKGQAEKFVLAVLSLSLKVRTRMRTHTCHRVFCLIYVSIASY